MSMNKWFGIGRITREIEKKTTQSGSTVVDFTIAVDDDYRPKDGSEKHVDFVDVVAWNALADFCEKYLGKGRKICVLGRLVSEKYTDKNGNNRVSWKVRAESIDFADSKKSDQAGGDYTSNSYAVLDEPEPELPF